MSWIVPSWQVATKRWGTLGTWVQLDVGFDPCTVAGLGLSPHFANDQTLYAATKIRGVFRSTDCGDSWQYVGLEGEFLTEIVLSPEYAVDETVYAGGWNGIFRTYNPTVYSSWEPVLGLRHYDDENEFIHFKGAWESYRDPFTNAGGVRWSEEADAMVQFAFYGDGIVWISARNFNLGKADVYIDEVFYSEVDLFAASGPEYQVRVFEADNLGPGSHTITIVVTHAKNKKSDGYRVVIDAFETRDEGFFRK